MHILALPVSGQRVAIDDLAGDDAASPAILFLHGLGSSSMATFAPILDLPGIRSFRRLLIDLPGFGESANEVSAFTIENYAEIAAGVVNTLGLTGVTLVGHSMGGSLAICVAHRRPDAVARLIMAEPNLDPATGTFSGQVTRMTEQRFVGHGRDAMLRAMHLAAARGDANAARFASTVAAAYPVAIHRAATSLRAERNPTFREMLHQVTMPKLYIGGELSNEMNTAGLKSHGIAVSVIPGAGHVMMSDAPEAFARIVSDFIQKTHGA
jgi:pimeloyl-ACP methyl ester carboxylesterase